MAHKVIIVKGKVRYYYNVESANGRIMSTSQKYWSLSNARRAAKKMAHDMKAKFIDFVRPR